MAHIQTFARLKPGKASTQRVQVDEEGKSVTIIAADRAQLSEPLQRGTRPRTPSDAAATIGRTFTFEKVFLSDASQEEVFEDVARRVVDNCVAGFNGTVFAYGQTGSGKTHTIGGGSRRYADRGLIPRALSHLYAEVDKMEGTSCTIHISYLEIYQDVGFDLLNPGGRGGSMVATLPKVCCYCKVTNFRTVPIFVLLT